MRIRITKARATAVALCGATATVTPVTVACGAQGQRRPGEYVLTCAGTGAQLTGLQWASWGPSSAFAAGHSVINDCVPSCAGGTGHAFPALVALWRAEPRPGHPGKN
jgi:hypothetical protein